MKFKLVKSQAADIARCKIAQARQYGEADVSDWEVLEEIVQQLKQSGEVAEFYRRSRGGIVSYTVEEMSVALETEAEPRPSS